MCNRITAQQMYMLLSLGRINEAYELCEKLFDDLTPDQFDRQAMSIERTLSGGGCDQFAAKVFVAGVLRNVKQRTATLELQAV